MSTLLLRLGGPLQSWGSDSKYDERKTDYMPTKSGVIGILAAALGRRRGENLSDLTALRFGVRVDRQGTLLRDLQTTRMAADLEEMFYKPPKLNGNLSNRYYLSDAVFVAGFESEDEAFIRRLEYAVRNPVFPPFLGRRSCPPTLPLLLGVRDKTLEEALYEEEWHSGFERGRTEALLRIVVDSASGHAMIRDVPISFSPFNRQYGSRYQKELEPKKISAAPDDWTDHDALGELTGR